MKTNETLYTIMARRSTRAYKSDSLPENVLNTILEAGQAAPYVMPESRHFSVIQSRTIIDRINETAIIEGSKISDNHRALFSPPGFDGTYGAPVIILVSGKEESIGYESVCAASIQNILIAAQSLGIATCWAYFPIFVFHSNEADKWREELQIPDGFKPCGAVLLGYGLEEISDGTDDRYKNNIVFIS